MDEQRFDELTRLIAHARVDRRGVFGGMAAVFAGLVAAAAPSLAMAKGQPTTVILCYRGLEFTVPETAVPVLLARGAQLGPCREQPGPGACAGATSPCDSNPTVCGDNCSCIATTSGGSVCATNEKVCLAGASTCTVDADCVARFGQGFACVSTAGCAGLHCGGNGNACVPFCRS